MPYRKDPKSFPTEVQRLVEFGAKNPPWVLQFDALNPKEWPTTECATPTAARGNQIQIYNFLRACGAYYRENPEGVGASELAQNATLFRRAWNVLVRGSKIVLRPAIIGDPERAANFKSMIQSIAVLKLPERPQDLTAMITFVREHGNSLDEFITHFGYKDVATAFMELQIINKSWEMNDLPFRFEENPWRIFLKEEHPLGAP